VIEQSCFLSSEDERSAGSICEASRHDGAGKPVLASGSGEHESDAGDDHGTRQLAGG
jgi:hypothetical protein